MLSQSVKISGYIAVVHLFQWPVALCTTSKHFGIIFVIPEGCAASDSVRENSLPCGCFAVMQLFSDGWGGITRCSCMEWTQYPTTLSQSHAHIAPLLNSWLDSFVRPMIIFSQSHVSSAVYQMIFLLTPEPQILIAVQLLWQLCLCNFTCFKILHPVKKCIKWMIGVF